MSQLTPSRLPFTPTTSARQRLASASQSFSSSPASQVNCERCVQLISENKELKSSRTFFEKRLGELSSDNEKLLAENARLESRIEEVFTENDELRAEFARLAAQFEEVTQQVEQLQLKAQSAPSTSSLHCKCLVPLCREWVR